MRFGDYDAAIAAVTRAIELAPRETSRRTNRATELDPKSVRALLGRGDARAALGDAAGALADFARFLALAPDGPNVPAVGAATEKARAGRPR